MNAMFHLNDDLILDRKQKNKSRDNDRHDHEEFDENETIDARV
jgi:hypothetical protein